MSQISKPAWAEINLTNIASNVRYILSLLPQNTTILAVVKANGYGHGAVQSAITALNSGASYLGVAMLDEGIELRRAGIAAPILIMGHIFQRHVKDAIRHGLTSVVATTELAEYLSDAALACGRKAKVHIKVDTGMGRIGISHKVACGFINKISSLPGLEIEGICSHLGTADCDHEFSRRQINIFRDIVDEVERSGIHIPIKHIANTAAAMSLPESAMDMVRVGIAMFGMSYTNDPKDTPNLQPALELKTSVEYLKYIEPGDSIGYGAAYIAGERELIATLPIGYADGYSRGLSGRGKVLIDGNECRIVGRICMDQMMVAVSADSDVEVGQEVVLIGTQGDHTIRVEDLANELGTICYEITCNISNRVQRVYIGK